MVLGAIDGGLGLHLANADDNLIIAYSIVASVMFLVYAIVKTIVSMRKKSPRHAGDDSRKWSGAGSSRNVEDVNEMHTSRSMGRHVDQRVRL